MTSEAIGARWSEIGDKTVQLAQAVPDGAYDFTPVPGVRSFAGQLRHVAFWNIYVRDTLRGGEPDGAANELPRDAYPGKSDVVGALCASFDDVRAELDARDGELDESALGTLVSFIEHAGEHYGQLVVYARLRGIVPPASRGEG